jgi:error-prone DNA polymerase
MRDIEVNLREGMNKNGITGKTQDVIVQAISSFALYGFPESHAASFALIAYASAYLKCRYLAAFTAAILNNQPMGFYAPATLVKDAQRHGLHFKPVDVTHSDFPCTIEQHDGLRHVRLGLNYVKGVREQSARSILAARAAAPFKSIQDFVNRVPDLRKDELRKLSLAGALNSIENTDRRNTLWTSALAVQPAGPLFANQLFPQPTTHTLQPISERPLSAKMETDDRERSPPEVSRLLCHPRPPCREKLVAGSRQRSHVALHQRRHEPVQGRVHGP